MDIFRLGVKQNGPDKGCIAFQVFFRSLPVFQNQMCGFRNGSQAIVKGIQI